MCKPLLCTLFLLGLFLQSGFSQDPVAALYSKKISIDSLKAALDVLASDSLEGRETGTPGQKKAAAFLAARFKSLQLLPGNNNSFLQEIYLSARANSGNNLTVRGKRFVFMKDFFYAPGFADTTLVIDTLLTVGPDPTGAAAPTAAAGIHKAILFLNSPESGKKKQASKAKWGVSEKRAFAGREGVAAAFMVMDTIEKAAMELPEGPTPEVPLVFITRKVAAAFFDMEDAKRFDRAQKRAAKGKPATILAGTQAQLPVVKNTEQLRGENVLGILEGTDKKDEFVVLTAHYDHLGIRDSLIYYGADDNGTGTSAVLEMARVFSEAAESGHRPRRSILFMTVSGEEKGLLGSNYFVKHPPIPLSAIVANLNTDMIGRTDPRHDSLQEPNYIYIIGSDKLSTTLHQINEDANEKVTQLKLDYTYNKPDDPNRYYYRSDHYNFAKNNIPVIFYFSGSHADYHKPTDTAEKIDYDLLARRTQLIFMTAWELANRDERIRVDVKSDMPEKRGEEN